MEYSYVENFSLGVLPFSNQTTYWVSSFCNNQATNSFPVALRAHSPLSPDYGTDLSFSSSPNCELLLEGRGGQGALCRLVS